jgi:hypothetical protein
MSNVYPENWVVLKMTNLKTNETFYKVFASWVGGYLDGDRWKINSGITKVDTDELNHTFYGLSGSSYICGKNNYGVNSSYIQSVLNSIIENASVGEFKVEVMSKDTKWNKIDYNLD